MELRVPATQRPWQELAIGFAGSLERVCTAMLAIKKAPALKAAPGGTQTNSAEAHFRQIREHSALQRNCRVIAEP
jgi:hypothetical protein